MLDKLGSDVSSVVADVTEDAIPDQGDLLVDVEYSSLNYKDALAVTGKGPVVRAPYPFVPGIDLSGRLVSAGAGFEVGDPVIVTGWGVGERYWGGLASRARVDPDWVLRRPDALSAHDAMVFGTAGLTAMLSVMALERGGVGPQDGEVVVTGATGGVGSLAVLILSQAGFSVVASTGGTGTAGYLRDLGATRVMDRDVLAAGPTRAMDSGIWAGAVDVVGGKTLASLLSQTQRHGVVAACGLVASPELQTTVFPFILRGVVLAGIDSNTCPSPLRIEAWQRLAAVAGLSALESLSEVIGLDDVAERCERLLEGAVRGRIVVDLAPAKPV